MATAAVPDMSLEHVREKAKRFVGKLHQVPPAYSAVRCLGKRAYQLARKGQAVELKSREITVHSLQILSMALPEIAFRVRCSSGDLCSAPRLRPGGRPWARVDTFAHCAGPGAVPLMSGTPSPPQRSAAGSTVHPCQRGDFHARGDPPHGGRSSSVQRRRKRCGKVANRPGES